jgi:putative oxidoreductase
MYGQLGPAMHTVLRVGAALLFMQHGLQKLFGFMGGAGENGATVQLMSQMGLAGMLEFGGGLLLLVGLATRPVAFILMCEMIAAYFIAHSPKGGWPVENQGELALFYALVFAFFVGNGAGPFSVDAALRVRRQTPVPA